MVCLNTVCTPNFFTAKFADHFRGVPAVIISIPAGIPPLSDPSPRYSRDIHNHTHTREKPADSAGFPPSPSCVQVKLWDPLRTRAIPERLRGVFMTRRYTNTRLSLPYLTHHRAHLWSQWRQRAKFIWGSWPFCPLWKDNDHNGQIQR